MLLNFRAHAHTKKKYLSYYVSIFHSYQNVRTFKALHEMLENYVLRENVYVYKHDFLNCNLIVCN